MNNNEVKYGKCALCDTENTILRESHSIPKFAYDWIKNTSKTPYLRDINDVNKRHQDGPKEYLLCTDCEIKLSVLEKKLSNEVFKKIANYREQKKDIVVSEEIKLAILSIFWRALLTTQENPNDRTPEDSSLLDDFLLSAKIQILSGECKTKIFITPFYGNSPYYNLPSYLTYGLERSIGAQDVRFYDNPHRFFAVFKLPFIYFHIFSDNWSVDEINKSTELKKGTIDLSSIKQIPNTLRSYILHMHKQFEKSATNMDQENIIKIMNDTAKNTKVTGSDKSMKRTKK